MSTRNVVRADAAVTDERGPAPPIRTSGGGEFTESEQRRRWLDAFRELLPSLLSGEAGPPYALIAQHAATAATADFAALTVPHGADQVIVAGVAGQLTAGMANRTAPLAGSLTGQAILTGQPSLVTGGRRRARGRDRPADRRTAGRRRAGPRRADAGPAGHQPGLHRD
jgi:hypothetical protein